MKLFFYSGGNHSCNLKVDEYLFEVIGKKDPVFSFIPSSSYHAEEDFSDFVDQYTPFGVEKFLNFPVDQDYSEILKEEVFKSDLIHLSGGNTFYFLKNLRRKKLLPVLKEYVKKGGILTGLSAGAIIMTPEVTTASFPDFDCDENSENLKDFKSMGLVNFEIFPHFKNSKRYQDEFLSYTKNTERVLYGLPDGSAISVVGDKTTFHGKLFAFYKGKKFQLNT